MLALNSKSAPEVKVSSELRKQLDNLSTLPVLDVPVRRRGITSGKLGKCYWNANVCSQTWGGEVVLGWMIYGVSFQKNIAITDKNRFLILYGHAIWKTPEGKLVDVTNHRADKDYLGFLPCLDIEPLLINGNSSETIRNFFYVHNQSEILLSLQNSISRYLDWNKRFFGVGTRENKGVLLPPDFNFSQFAGKLIRCDGFPLPFIDKIIKTSLGNNKLSSVGKSVMYKALSTFIHEVDTTTPKKVLANPTLSLREVIHTAIKENKSVFECFESNDLIALDGMDMTWGCQSYEGDFLSNISTASGKKITQIPPLPSLVQQHKVPTQKKRRRKIEKIAKKHNLTINEVLMLSNPVLHPHPYLVNKAGGSRITRV